jgi:hypothetical protein
MGRPLRDRDEYMTPEPAEAPQPAGSGTMSGWKVKVETTRERSLKSIDVPDNSVLITRTLARSVADFFPPASTR